MNDAVSTDHYRLTSSQLPNYTAFEGHRCIASGGLADVVRKVKAATDRGTTEAILVFDDYTGSVVELDLRGTADEVIARLNQTEQSALPEVETPTKRGPGRPKLGVIPREVTLLPSQWDWLDAQSGGASAALRRLVYEAKRSSVEKDSTRQAQEAVYRFMTTMAGNFPGFEEALRAFYRREHQRFGSLVEAWPKDVRNQVNRLVERVRRQ